MSEQAQRGGHSTLADAKPGGMVRLADQALSTTELCRNAHVLVLQELRARFTDAGSPSRTAALDAAIAALSAQPSPGGQGDAWAIKLARESAFAHSSEHAYLPQTREEANNWQPHEWVVAAIQTAAHGAPKPEGQEPITVEAVAEIFNHPEYGLSINWLLENGIGELQVGDVLMVSNRAITDEDGAGEVYAAPPAQQSAQVYLDGLDRALGEAIDQRDRYHEMADDLAEHIAAITGVDIGEHSSANCPWQNAIEAAEEYKPAQAVDLWQMPHGIRLVEIPRRNGLDPINVFVQDYELGRGRIVVTCYGQAWCGFWGAMGDLTVMQFVAACDADYVAGNMLSGRYEHVKKHERTYVERIATEVIAEFRALIDGKAVRNG